jgi:hypothetical protein
MVARARDGGVGGGRQSIAIARDGRVGVGVSLPKQIAEPAGRGRPRATKDVQPSFSVVVLRVDGGEADTTPRRRLLARYQRVWPEPSALLSSACQIWQK